MLVNLIVQVLHGDSHLQDQGMASLRGQQHGVQFSSHRNQKLQRGRHCGYPKWLSMTESQLELDQTIIQHVSMTNVPKSFLFNHLCLTCRSWFSVISCLNVLRRCLDSRSLRPLILSTWLPTAKTLFQPVTGLVRMTG